MHILEAPMCVTHPRRKRVLFQKWVFCEGIMLIAINFNKIGNQYDVHALEIAIKTISSISYLPYRLTVDFGIG